MLNYRSLILSVAILMSIEIGCQSVPKTSSAKFYPNGLEILIGENSIRPVVRNATIKQNYFSHIFNNKSEYLVEVTGNKDADLMWIFRPPRNFSIRQNIGIWLLFNDPTAITQVVLEIYSKDNNVWIRSTRSENVHTRLSNGWELFRWRVCDANVNDLGVNVSKIRLIFQTKRDTKIAVGYIFAENPDKAKLLFVEDGGYSKGWVSYDLAKGQKISGIEACSRRNMPITWALNPGLVPLDNTTNTDTISLPYLKIMRKNPVNRWSFHSFKREVLANFSEEEMKDDVRKSIEWLEKHGFGHPHFRAAHMQNYAPKAYATIGYMGLHALATWTRKTGGFETFPFIDRWDLTRTAIHGLSFKRFDEIFDILKKRRCLLIAYTHKIVSDDSSSIYDIKLRYWKYFLKKIDIAVSEGWLELVSYEDLEKVLNKYGIKDNDKSIAEALLKELQVMSTNRANPKK